MHRGNRAEWIGNIAALAEIRSPGGGRVADGVGENALDVWILVDRKRFVAGAEIDDFALAASPRAAAAEDFAPFEPADREQLVRLRDVEVLAVHLALLDLEKLVGQAFG